MVAILTLTSSTPSNTTVQVLYTLTGSDPSSNKTLNLVLNDVTASDANGADWITNSVALITDASGSASGSFVQSGLTNGVEYMMMGNIGNLYDDTNGISITSCGAPLKPVISTGSKTASSVDIIIDTGASQGLPVSGGTVYMKQLTSKTIVHVAITPAMIIAMVGNVITVPVAGLSQDIPYECFAIVYNNAAGTKSDTIRFALSTMLPPVTSPSSSQIGNAVTVGFTLPAFGSYESNSPFGGLIAGRTASGVTFKVSLYLANGAFSQDVIYTPVLAAGSFDTSVTPAVLIADRNWVTSPTVTFNLTDADRQFVTKSFSLKIVSQCPNPNVVQLQELNSTVSVQGLFGTDLTLPSNNVTPTTSGTYAASNAKISLDTKLYFNSAGALNSFNAANTGFGATTLVPVAPTLIINARWIQMNVQSGVASLANISSPSVVIGSTLANSVAFSADFTSDYFGKQMKLQIQSVSGIVTSPFVDAGVSKYIQAAPEMNVPLGIENSEYLSKSAFRLTWLAPNSWGETITGFSLFQSTSAISSVDGSTIITETKYANDFAATAREAFINTDASGASLVQSTTYSFKLVANGTNSNTAVVDVSNGVTASLAFGAMYIKDQTMGVVNKDGKATLTWKSDYTQIAWITYPNGNPQYQSVAQQQAKTLTTVISANADLQGATSYPTGTITADINGTNGVEGTYYFRQSVTILNDIYYSEIQSFKIRPFANLILANPLASYTYNAITTLNGVSTTASTFTTVNLATAKTLTSANAANISSSFSVDVTLNGSALQTYAVIGVPATADPALMAISYASGTNVAAKMVDTANPTRYTISYAGIFSAAIIQISGTNGGAMAVVPSNAVITSA